MIMKDIDFGSVFLASGALNFFGEGWWYHWLYKLIPGFSFNGSTFISKTTTLNSREGNMPLKPSLQPKELMPNCVKLYPVKGVVLNSVGLSGPGAHALLQSNRWQQIRRPFLLSFMAVENTPEKRKDETKAFDDLLGQFLPDFLAQVGLEINISCPNTQHNPSDLISEAVSQLDIVSKLEIPLLIKLNALSDPVVVKEICDSGLCDAIECSNTIPWGQLPERINWKALFGTAVSPLADLGGGGLSGWPLVEIVTDWIKRVRDIGVTIPIIAGGGIGCQGLFGDSYKRDILSYKEAGADGIAVGTIIMLRPWKVQRIVNFGNKIFGKEG